MSKFKIISKDSESVRYEGAPQYSGTYLGVDYIEFKNISSPTVIDWQIGDYVDYFRTGVRYKLHTLPMPKKVARVGSYGGAIEYSNVQFFAPTKDLEIAPYKDLVLNDNGIHFSTRMDSSTTEDVHGIARRIQACMNDLFPNKWRIEVFESDDADLNNLLAEVKDFSVSQSSCLDALSQIYDTWKGVGWIHYTDKDSGQEVVVIGRANVRDDSNTTDLFTYGIGNGLTSLRKNSANEGEFATRLYVYGSERNLQPRYYNQFDIVSKESVDIRNLMIPISEWGLTDGIPDPKKAYLQADDSIIEKYGLIPKTIYFDGSENEEIYPSIKGLTSAEVRQAMIDGKQESWYLPEDSNERIDQIRSRYSEGDGSADDFNSNPTFIVTINGIGFDLVELGKKTSEGVAKLSMKSGMCAGREFIVREFVDLTYGENGVIRTRYKVERAWDESLATAFPYNLYPLNEGDEFVLLDIPMPDYFISINENRLLEKGRKMLADYTRVSAFYEPEVNAIRMKEIGGIITPGMYMKVKDDDIIETEDHMDYVLIDSLSIDEITELPTYKITLREEKRAARTYSALEDMIEDAKENANQAIKRERQYTDRRFKSAQETLSMLEGAFSSFSKGITPATVQTMALLIGDESLQYKFTASRDSLADVPCPLSWSPDTKQVLGVPASLIHMTLNVHSITMQGGRKASDYMGWNILSWWDKDTYQSPFIEDADKSYYVYVKASTENNDAWYFIDEKPHLLEEGGYYYFLVGILNSEYEGSRDFVTLYGFTEVLPGRITTDVIMSGDGSTYFNLQDGVIAGDIRFIAPDGEEKQVSEFAEETEFLKDTFKKGETNISGGVVMTEMVAVGEGGNNIKAFLNGNDEFSDDEHETLILAGGIPATSKSGSADLKDRAKEAKIRMYQDGDFVMKGGGISVERGNVGPFYLGDTSTMAAREAYPEYDTKVILQPASIALVSEDFEYGKKISVSIGSHVGSTYGSLSDADGNKLFNISHSYTRGILITAEDSGDDIRGVLEIRREGDGSKCAIEVEKGYFAGLRPKIRTVSSNGTLSNLDHSIMLSSSSSLTINLPSPAEVGHVIEIYLPYQSSTTLKHRIQGNGLGIQCPHNNTWNNSYFDILAYGIVRFVCIADANGDKYWWFYRIA